MARKHHLLSKYGITEEQYVELYEKQHGCCAVCGKHSSEFRTRLAVDHEHTSGEIRGLLCTYCNHRIVGRHRKGVGAFLLYAAAKYLDREYTGWVVPPKAKRKKKRNGKRKKSVR